MLCVRTLYTYRRKGQMMSDNPRRSWAVREPPLRVCRAMRRAIGEGALRWTGWVWVASRVSVTPLARMQGGTWRVRASAGFVLARACVRSWCQQSRLCVVRLALGFIMLFVGAAVCVGAYE